MASYLTVKLDSRTIFIIERHEVSKKKKIIEIRPSQKITKFMDGDARGLNTSIECFCPRRKC